MGIVTGCKFAMEVMRVCGIDTRYVTGVAFDIEINEPVKIHITRCVTDEETQELCEVLEQYQVTKTDHGEEQK